MLKAFTAACFRCLALCALLFALSVPVTAAQPNKVHRIGYLIEITPLAGASLLTAFREGLRDFGYIEGKNVSIEPRWAEKRDQLPVFAAELVRLKVDVIVTAATSPSIAAHRATKSIPIVMAHMSDPVEAGLVASLARPGGNVTGSRSLQAELGGKRLEVLKETFPAVSRVAVLGIGIDPGSRERCEKWRRRRSS